MLHAANRFSVTRQLRYSLDETRRALDLCLFINGLPIATFELKNSLTKQTVGRCRRAVQARPRSARAAFRLRPLRGALRGGRQRGADVHRAEGEGVVVPAVQQGLERRRRQSAEPARPEDRLSVEDDPDAGRADRHPRELRPDRRGEGPEDRQEEARADLSALPPAGRGAEAAGRCARARRGQALPDPALGGQRQIELHRLARAPAHRRARGRQARSSTRSSS